MRALNRTLGPRLHTRFQASTHPETLERVVLSALAVQFLKQQLHLPGRARGGLLFGHHHGDTLRVLLAGSGGLPGWLRGDEERAVLDIDARFAFGWGEAVSELLQGHVDWCGNWLMHPDEQLAGHGRDHHWFRRGLKRGLFDDRHILLVAGYEQGQLNARAYLLGTPDEPLEIQCEFEPGDVGDTLKHLSELLVAGS
ncbi:hypothetical protein [Deinococcus sp. UYEF24]